MEIHDFGVEEVKFLACHCEVQLTCQNMEFETVECNILSEWC